MIENILAARYARAIGAIAKEKGILDQVFLEINMLADISMPDRGEVAIPELLTFLHAPSIPLEDKIKITDIMLNEMKFSTEVGNLLNILIRRGRVNLVGNIANNLKKQSAQLKNMTIADIESAFPLSRTEIDNIKNILETSLKNKVDIHIKINPELIGGLKIRIGDKLVDGSIDGRLELMENSLKKQH